MRYIAVDGPTGVGKTTTARAIAERLDLPLLRDPVSASPLLDDYYVGYDDADASLRAERRFLDLRANVLPLRSDNGEGAGDSVAVTDFVLARTGPFSEFLDLPDHREAMRLALDAELAARTPPTALVLLTASPETLLGRVRERDRDAEQTLSLEHLESLCAHFASWHSAIVDGIDDPIVIDTEHWSPHDAADINALVAALRTRR